jgi:hypothetical protein
MKHWMFARLDDGPILRYKFKYLDPHVLNVYLVRSKDDPRAKTWTKVYRMVVNRTTIFSTKEPNNESVSQYTP